VRPVVQAVICVIRNDEVSVRRHCRARPRLGEGLRRRTRSQTNNDPRAAAPGQLVEEAARKVALFIRGSLALIIATFPAVSRPPSRIQRAATKIPNVDSIRIAQRTSRQQT
jgi:hypothetical protein